MHDLPIKVLKIFLYIADIQFKGKYPFFHFDALRKLDFFLALILILKLLSY